MSGKEKKEKKDTTSKEKKKGKDKEKDKKKDKNDKAEKKDSKKTKNQTLDKFYSSKRWATQSLSLFPVLCCPEFHAHFDSMTAETEGHLPAKPLVCRHAVLLCFLCLKCPVA